MTPGESNNEWYHYYNSNFVSFKDAHLVNMVKIVNNFVAIVLIMHAT